MRHILLPLAPGFEEIEAVAPVDILRRLGFEVRIAGLDAREVVGAHGILLKADGLLAEVKADEVLAVVLPGGLPGSIHLRDSALVLALLQQVHAAGKPVAAICAAPMVLHKAGLLAGKKATCYPGVEASLLGTWWTGLRLEQDGRILTAQGAGVALDFGFAFAGMLGKGPEAAVLRQAMIAG